MITGILGGLLLVVAPASAQWIGTVDPPNGSAAAGTTQLLKFNAYYESTTTLPELDVIMNNANSGLNGCYFIFFQNPNTTNVPTVYLFDDNGVNWYPVRLATSDTASNSEEVALAAGSTVILKSVTAVAGVKVHFLISDPKGVLPAGLNLNSAAILGIKTLRGEFIPATVASRTESTADAAVVVPHDTQVYTWLSSSDLKFSDGNGKALGLGAQAQVAPGAETTFNWSVSRQVPRKWHIALDYRCRLLSC